MDNNYNSFNKKFFRFLTRNEDLIYEYEEKTGDTLESLASDIYPLCRSIELLTKDSVNIILKNALSLSIINETSIIDTLELLVSRSQVSGGEKNSLKVYFKDINDIYNKNNNEFDIEYCPENREKLIEMNLKSVISVAKCYQGLGVDLEDLISAGNVGLCEAFKQYDPVRAKLKDDVLLAIDKLENDITFNELRKAIDPYLKYGAIKKKMMSKFHEGCTYKKSDVIKWVKKNIQNAKFNSVAIMWIKAYILIEIDTNSRLVKKPKSEVLKDKQIYGSYKKEQLVNIDAPINGDGNTPLSDIIVFEDNTKSHLDIEESQKTFKENLELLLDGVKSRDRRILLQKFGIGLPRPMQPKEISGREGLSIARISQILQSTISTMKYNQAKYGISEETLYSALEKMI